jgi:hypothetical protein
MNRLIPFALLGGCFSDAPDVDATNGSSTMMETSEASSNASSDEVSDASSESESGSSSSSISTSSSSESTSEDAETTTEASDPGLMLWHTWNGDYVDQISGEAGTPTGDATVNSSALELGGSGSVDISHFSLDYTAVLESMTVSIRYFANTGDGLHVLLALGDSGEVLSNNAHEIRIRDNIFEIMYETGNGEDHFVDLGPTPQFVIGSWHTASFVFDSDQIRVCSDGVWLPPATTVVVPETTAQKLFVGGTWIPGEGWIGLVDDIKIWDHPRSSAALGCN